ENRLNIFQEKTKKIGFEVLITSLNKSFLNFNTEKVKEKLEIMPLVINSLKGRGVQGINQIQKMYEGKFSNESFQLPLLYLIRTIIAFILLPFSLITLPFLLISNEIEDKISFDLRESLDDLSIPSFLLYRFVILPVLLILDIVFRLLGSPFLMCVYVIGFFDNIPGERSFISFIIVILYWFYKDLYIFIFLKGPHW
ncbi:MAG: hypothetical protein U9R21_08195, partial [Candidatus Thermoplasmatota archaeon]|nr:hypothetical protein [Candidatus Thermoplasmatota archaeon]